MVEKDTVEFLQYRVSY